MTATDHHSRIGDSNCTNSTIATVKCAGAAESPFLILKVTLQRVEVPKNILETLFLNFFFAGTWKKTTTITINMSN